MSSLSLDQNINKLADNKLFLGLAILATTFGTKFFQNELTTVQENLLNTSFSKIVLLFIFIFLSCKDIYISLILLICVLCLYYLFNEYSKFNIVPKNIKNTATITNQQYNDALKTINKYQEQLNEAQTSDNVILKNYISNVKVLNH